MTAKYFLDTNILLYAYDLDAPAKRKKAVAIVEQALQQPDQYAISELV